MEVETRNSWNISVFDQFSIFKMAPGLEFNKHGMYLYATDSLSLSLSLSINEYRN